MFNKNKKNRKRSLYSSFIVKLSILLAVIIIPTTLGFILLSEKSKAEETRVKLSNISDTRTDASNKFLELEEIKLETFKNVMNKENLDIIKRELSLTSNSNDVVDSYFIVTGDNSVIGEGGESFVASNFQEDTRNSTDRYVYSIPYVDTVTGASVITISTKVDLNNNPNSVLAVNIPTKGLAEYIFSQSSEDELVFETLVTTKDGKIIFNSGETISDSNPTVENEISLEYKDTFGNSVISYNGQKYITSSNEMRNSWTYTALLSYQNMIVRTITYIIADLVAISIFIGFIILIVVIQFRPVSIEIRKIRNLVYDMANYKLDGTLNINRKDELGELEEFILNLQDSYRNIIKSNKEMSEQILNIATSVKEKSSNNLSAFRLIHTSSNEMSIGISEQANHIMEITSVADESVRTVTEISELLSRVNKTSESSTHLSKDGSEQSKLLLDSTKEMDDALKDVKDISEIILKGTTEVINTLKEIEYISEQSSILSINARIQAARAGESGQSFSVVADEMSNLAGQTKGMSENINKRIQMFIESIKTMTVKLDFCLDQFTKTNGFVNKTHRALDFIQRGNNTTQEEISNSMVTVENFKDGITLLATNIEATAAIVEENTALLEEVANKTTTELQSVITLNDEIESLKSIVETNKESYNKYVI